MEIVICPKCKGVGKVDVFKYKNHSEGSVYIHETCPLCKGLRVVNKTISITYTPISIPKA